MLLVGLCLLHGCGGPLGPFPGGMLEGTPAPVDPTWSRIGDARNCEIETNPAEPYSVTVACTVIDGQLYVNAGGTAKPWAKNIIADPNVRVRVDGEIYALRGTRVEDPAEIARFARAWTSQSFFRRDPTAYDEVWVFRLVPRTATGAT